MSKAKNSMQEWSLKIMTQQQIVLKLTKSMQKNWRSRSKTKVRIGVKEKRVQRKVVAKKALEKARMRFESTLFLTLKLGSNEVK